MGKLRDGPPESHSLSFLPATALLPPSHSHGCPRLTRVPREAEPFEASASVRGRSRQAETPSAARFTSTRRAAKAAWAA